MKKKLAVVFVCVLAALAALHLMLRTPSTGAVRFYADQPYHFNVLRAFTDIPFGGGDAGEIFSAIRSIPEGDDEQWFLEWEKLASRVEKEARACGNRVSRGNGLLRAHAYYRTGEFFLHPSDPRRPVSFKKNQRAFYDALASLRIPFKKISIPYGKYTLKAIYYPGGAGSEKKPLIVMCGGYDSTLEELYFMLAAGALQRGYSCLTYEGPGQGSIIREQRLRFTHEWEKPTKAVLDEFERRYTGRQKIVLVGASLGGYLAPRAAAFDDRIDGVVAYDVCFDFQEAALKQVPGFMSWLYRNGFTGMVNTLIGFKMRTTPGVRWGVQNAQWTMGAKDAADLLQVFSLYNLKDVSSRIGAHVLILAGEKDHFFPVSQVERFRKALTNARSVTTRVFTEEEGGHEHCQMGAIHLFHAALFEWIEKTF